MLYGPEYESGKIGSLTPFEPEKPGWDFARCGPRVASIGSGLYVRTRRAS